MSTQFETDKIKNSLEKLVPPNRRPSNPMVHAPAYEDANLGLEAYTNSITRKKDLSQSVIQKSFWELKEKHSQKPMGPSIKDRQQLLQRLEQYLRREKSSLYLTEILPLLSEIQHTKKNIKSWSKARKVKTPWSLFGHQSSCGYRPKGVALIIAPWNYPLYLAVSPLISALGAGCRVILKPSEKLSFLGQKLKEDLPNILGNDFCQVFLGGKEVVEELTDYPFDHLFFTGSPEIGSIVMQRAARHLTSVTLELGGKSPCLVEDVKNLSAAIKTIVWGKFTNAGQTCVAPDFIACPKSLYPIIVQEIKHQISLLYGNDESGILYSNDYASLVDRSRFEKMQSLLKNTPIEFGNTWDKINYRLTPTVVGPLSIDHPLMQEEIFGPILPIITYEERESFWNYHRSQPTTLVFYIFSDSPKIIKEAKTNLNAGTLSMGQTLVHLANPHLAFGGHGKSGIGSSHGRYGFEAFSVVQNYFFKKRGNIMSLFYPPYNSRSKSLLRLMMKWGTRWLS
jgi:aldehyde dehydrogenase (NAD+)